MAYVYILQNENGRYYVGSTSNLEKRMQHHRGGYTPSTRRLKAFQLVFSQKYDSLFEARDIERRLKKLKRHDYLQKIIRDGKIQMK
ncbi:MAG: GIY-YIG nuclease family protein [Parcubacteria group bacterium]|nr:GIY-YIG nuclease family protein [Parcubacteria group bacterium]